MVFVCILQLFVLSWYITRLTLSLLLLLSYTRGVAVDVVDGCVEYGVYIACAGCAIIVVTSIINIDVTRVVVLSRCIVLLLTVYT